MTEQIMLESVGTILSNIGNEIVTNQRILKCLKYNGDNALSQPDLTAGDIRDIVGKGNSRNEQCRIFHTPFNDQIVSDVRSELRFFVDTLRPNNVYLTDFPITFQIIIHNSIWNLQNNIYRPFVLMHEVLKTFNGTVDMGGIGMMSLVAPIMLWSYNPNFSGYAITLSTRLP